MPSARRSCSTRAEGRGRATRAKIAVGAIAIAFCAWLRAGETRCEEGGDAAAWIAHAASCFEGAGAFEADVTWSSEHPLGVRELPRQGRISAARGGLFRFELPAPRPYLVVSDGKTVRSWSADDRLLIEEPFAGSPLAAALSLGLGEAPGKGVATRWLGGARTPEEGGPAALEIALGSGRPEGGLRAVVALAPACPSLRRIVVESGGGAVVSMDVGSARPGLRPRKSLFDFSPPRGARIVRP
jgi:hypothetical protein